MSISILSTFNIIAEGYSKADNNRACCIENGNFHQRCSCPLSLDNCKMLCDQDTYNCKGYAKTSSATDECDIATTSNCSSIAQECKTYDTGNVGDLTLAGTCGETSKYFGCFIKDHGN